MAFIQVVYAICRISAGNTDSILFLLGHSSDGQMLNQKIFDPLLLKLLHSTGSCLCRPLNPGSELTH